MFTSTLSQKTITSFFTSISEASNKPPKKISEKPVNVVEQEETSSSPIKINKRKRERLLIQSDDEDENLSDRSYKSPSIKEESSPEKKQVDKFRDFFKNERATKRIKTYSKAEEEIEVEVDFKEDKVDFEFSKEITKSTPKSKKILNNFSEIICENADSSDPSMSPKSVKTSIKDDKKKIEDFDPSKKNYHPVNDACWNKGEKVSYLALCKTLDVIEGISARLKMTEVLSNFFRSVILLSPEDLTTCIYLCLNKLAPDFEGIELGVGDMVLMKAIALTTGKSIESLKSELAAKGDLGIVAESCRTNQRTMFALPKLTSNAVYVKLREIAEMSGHLSTNKKVEKIQSLLVACHRLEARYLIRSLIGKLRIGLAEQSLLAALAQAVTLTSSDQKDNTKQLSKEDYSKLLEKNTMIIKSTYCECPSYDAIIPVLLKDGINELSKNCKITPGVPVKPMLAHPTKGVSEILKRFQECTFTCEFKYDGERAQIHVLDDSSIKIYSRNQEDNTSKYPDVISRLSKTLCEDVKSCILDTEAVAWDKVTKQILPFQILSTRKRKDATESQIKVQVCIFAFDLIYLNGRSLVAQPFDERRKLLHTHFKEINDEFAFVTSKDSNDVDEIAVFIDEAIKNKCEGLMMKTLETNATYEIAKRSHNWLKLKKDYLEGVGDTLDLVVIGGYYGKGKRAGNYGGFLLACYDPESEQFQTITKIGTGFKDEDLAQHSSYLKQHVIPKPKSYFQYDPSQVPDVWFDATQVWEVKCADLSISPVYKAAAGIVDPIKGISIRFPRFIRVREDKNPEDATSSEQVVTMYESQESVK